ncbi:MAG: hypothetical protein ACJ768_04340 [Gaiellaceae bacterium]
MNAAAASAARVRTPRIDAWRLAPITAAAIGAATYLAIHPHTVDLAAHVYRTGLFAREGFTIWNGGWYAGHHTPAYSVLFPPLAWLIGTNGVGVLSALASAVLFAALARGHWGQRARWGAVWFGLATATLLFTGRIPFAMGIAVGLGSLLALQRRRTALACALAVACSLSSPIAGLFLVLAAAACGLSEREWRRPAAAVGVAALVPPVLLSLAFPEGGWEPFVLSAFLPVPLAAAAAVIVLPRRERALRIGAALYGLAGIAAYAIHTPMGGNAMRLGALFAAPVLVSAVRVEPGRRRALFVALLVALTYWQWTSATQDFAKSQEDPTAQASYYRPLVDFLKHAGGPPGRVEVVFTRSHWEAAEVAPYYPLARGWQRQLDLGRDGIFYGNDLNQVTYGMWLAEHAVRFVAVPDGKPDYSSYRERGLIETGLPYLRQVWRSRNWRVYAVTLPHAMAADEPGADIRAASMGNDSLTLAVRKPGSAIVRVRWTPYWRAPGGCVERAGDWTRVIAKRSGTLRMAIDFSPVRIFEHGRRCS